MSRIVGASVSSNIKVDMKRALKNDDIAREFNKKSSKLLMIGLGFIAVGAAIIWFGFYVIGGVAAAIGLLPLFLLKRKGRFDKRFLSEIYTEGLLIPAVVRKTEPLTILALARLDGSPEHPIRMGCQEFKVRGLPGHDLKPGEQIPCAAVFDNSSVPGYWKRYEAHPLCWATDDMGVIRKDIERLYYDYDDSDGSNECDNWKALKELRKSLPDHDLDLIHVLDEDYNYILSRKRWKDPGLEAFNRSLYDDYPKNYGDIVPINPENPNADVSKVLAELSVKHQVYEYFFRRDKDGAVIFPVYETDPVAFLAQLDKLGYGLQSDEVPIIAGGTLPNITGSFLATTKGIWRKNTLTPWKDVSISTDGSSVDKKRMRIFMNENSLVDVSLFFEAYALPQERIDDEIVTLCSIERYRFFDFWMDLKKRFE